MDEADLLIQRFVDNDLTAEQRIRFVRLLDQDKALRRRLLDLEGLLAEVHQLPRFDAPPDLAAELRAGMATKITRPSSPEQK
jgi:hypothetical protein